MMILPTIKNGHTGYIDTNINTLKQRMNDLIKNPEEAERMGQNAKEYAKQRFGIDRFITDWAALFNEKVNEKIYTY